MSVVVRTAAPAASPSAAHQLTPAYAAGAAGQPHRPVVRAAIASYRKHVVRS
jgi:hypothetical protein